MLELIAITDDVMEMSSEPDYHERKPPQKVFITDLGSMIFCIGVYTYNTPCSVCT